MVWYSKSLVKKVILHHENVIFATLHSAAACIYSEFSKFGLHAYFWKIQVILRCRNPFLAFFSDCAVDFKGPTLDTFSYVFPIPSTEKQLKQL